MHGTRSKEERCGPKGLGQDVELTPQMAQQWVAEAFLSTTADSIQADVRTLPDTWRIVKSRTNVTVLTSKHEKVQGSNRDYPPSSSYR